MTRTTARRAIRTPRPGTPFGVWLIAKTPVDRPYPCRCWLGKRCRTTSDHAAYLCPCWGRTDLDHLPSHCCAKRATTREEAHPDDSTS